MMASINLRMLKLFTTLVCMAFLLLGATQITPASNETEKEYKSTELPGILIAYSLYCSRYDEFKSLESNAQNPLIKLSNALGEDISTGMAFVHMAFIVQDNIEGHLSGFAKINEPHDSILFVTTPIESFNDRILVVVSSVAPESTTVFSVDNKLKTEILYRSFDEKFKLANQSGNGRGNTSIGSIYSVSVPESGHLLLNERPGCLGGPDIIRTFEIDVSKGDFKLFLKAEDHIKKQGRER